MKALKETGQLENTLVIYTADQGFAMGEHGMRMKIAPYDASYRSPLIVSMPGAVAAGKVCRQMANAPDLVATLLRPRGRCPARRSARPRHHAAAQEPVRGLAASVPLRAHRAPLTATMLRRCWRTNPKEAIYQKVPWYTAVVHGGWKYIRYLQPGVPEELYDLAADPEELKNLAAKPEARGAPGSSFATRSPQN